MSGMHVTGSRGRTTAQTVALWLLFVPCLLLAGATLMEPAAPSAAAHLEAAGIGAHYAHHAADCVSCAGHRIQGVTSAERNVQLPLAPRLFVAAGASVLPRASAVQKNDLARAPPRALVSN